MSKERNVLLLWDHVIGDMKGVGMEALYVGFKQVVILHKKYRKYKGILAT